MGREEKARGWRDRMGHIEVCVCKFMVSPRQREIKQRKRKRKSGTLCPEHSSSWGERQERGERTRTPVVEEVLFSLVCPFLLFSQVPNAKGR